MKRFLLVAILSLSSAHAQEVHIYCGQGLSGCSDKPLPPVVDPGYSAVEGNVNQVIMNGTHMTITYLPDSSSYEVTWGQNSRYTNSLEAAIALAHKWSEEIVTQGEIP